MNLDEWSLTSKRDAILEAIDEYTLYCFYTGIDDLIPGRIYSAPYRRDDKPSFCVYYTNAHNSSIEFMWKDHATNESGDIFVLVGKIKGIKSKDLIYEIINSDFGYTSNQLVVSQESSTRRHEFLRPKRWQAKISIKEIPFTESGRKFWEALNIGLDLLALYHVTQVQYYWTYEGQLAPITASDPTFAYRIGGYYQLYSPYNEKGYKFKSDLPSNYFFGYEQLPERGDVLIIDKSCKDVIFCRVLGYYAIAPKSETTRLPDNKIHELRNRFPRIFVMFDNDEAGKKMAAEYVKLYPFIIPKFLTKAKDKTDLCKLIGFEETKKEVDRLINER